MNAAKQFPVCACKKPEFAKVLPVSMDEQGRRRLEHNRRWIGQFVCFDCGGIAESEPPSWDHVTGGTVIGRLIELGVAEECP